jgi:hypothetical protein
MFSSKKEITTTKTIKTFSKQLQIIKNQKQNQLEFASKVVL